MMVFLLTLFDNIVCEPNNETIGIFATREEARSAGDRYIKVSNKISWPEETSEEDQKHMYSFLAIEEYIIGDVEVIVDKEKSFKKQEAHMAKCAKAINERAFESMH